jgi:hypothetical protein
MVRDALDSLFTGNFEMVDSRALDLIGRGSSQPAEGKLSTFSDLGKAGVKFGSSSDSVRTASQEPMRIIEALDRGVHTRDTEKRKAEGPSLTFVEKPVVHKKPKKAKAPAVTGFGMHDFDGPRPHRQPLVDGLTHFLKRYENVH